MIVDSSAVLAILNDDPEGPGLAALLGGDPQPKVSAATLVQITHAAGRSRRGRVDELICASETAIIAFDHHQAHVARDAFHRYGRGSGHRARLHLGDCFTDALAKTAGQPLLFKGDDFTHTDITAAR